MTGKICTKLLVVIIQGEMMIFFLKSHYQQFSADNNLSSVFHIHSEAQSHHLKFIKHTKPLQSVLVHYFDGAM